MAPGRQSEERGGLPGVYIQQGFSGSIPSPRRRGEPGWRRGGGWWGASGLRGSSSKVPWPLSSQCFPGSQKECKKKERGERAGGGGPGKAFEQLQLPDASTSVLHLLKKKSRPQTIPRLCHCPFHAKSPDPEKHRKALLQPLEGERGWATAALFFPKLGGWVGRWDGQTSRSAPGCESL